MNECCILHTQKKDRKAKRKKETFQNRTAQSIIKPNQIENKKKWEPRRKTPDQDRYGMVFYPLQFFFSNTCQKVNFFLSSRFKRLSRGRWRYSLGSRVSTSINPNYWKVRAYALLFVRAARTPSFMCTHRSRVELDFSRS